MWWQALRMRGFFVKEAPRGASENGLADDWLAGCD
jgi:hypothetical protein